MSERIPKRTLIMKFKAIIRYYARMAIYSTPLRLLTPVLRRSRAKKVQSRDWDQMMAGAFASYLERTPGIAVRDGLMGALLHHYGKPNAVLDVGCGSGSFAETLCRYQVSGYLGVDISNLAVKTGREAHAKAPHSYPTDTAFCASGLEGFEPPANQSFDAICFSEVLYYLDDPGVVVAQMRRYCKYLNNEGLICVSMKDDPKSHAIFRVLADHFEWVAGTLYQQHDKGPAFRVNINQERPAFLIGLIRPKHGTSIER